MSTVKQTFSGNRGLVLEEALIFEIGVTSKCGVDLEPVPDAPNMLGDCGAKQAVNLPGLSEPEAMRHYVRLSQKNHSIDAGLYPLRSCTMKHNPRLT